MHLTFLRRLLDHMEWADAELWQAVLSEEAATDDAYVMDGLAHLHFVQRVYLSVWVGRPDMNVVRASDFERPSDMGAWARGYYPELLEFMGSLDEERLREVIPVPWTDFLEKELGGPAAPATLGDMVFQVASHSVHHRAQINRRLREVGGSPAFIDYIAWVWRGCPSPDWPVSA